MDGQIFQLGFLPNKSDYIAVCIHRNKLSCLNQEISDNYSFIINMLNAEDPAENYCLEEESHWTGQEEEKWYKF